MIHLLSFKKKGKMVETSSFIYTSERIYLKYVLLYSSMFNVKTFLCSTLHHLRGCWLSNFLELSSEESSISDWYILLLRIPDPQDRKECFIGGLKKSCLAQLVSLSSKYCRPVIDGSSSGCVIYPEVVTDVIK